MDKQSEKDNNNNNNNKTYLHGSGGDKVEVGPQPPQRLVGVVVAAANGGLVRGPAGLLPGRLLVLEAELVTRLGAHDGGAGVIGLGPLEEEEEEERQGGGGGGGV